MVMTVANTPGNVIRAIQERAFSYFSKPFSISAVAEMVGRALGSEPSNEDIEVLSARPNWLGLRLRCKMETADRILRFLREMGMILPVSEQENIALAFREILLTRQLVDEMIYSETGNEVLLIKYLR